MTRVVEADVCILGGGITAAMAAERLAATSDVRILVVEAGDPYFNLEERFANRQRMLDYRENPWPGDFIEGQTGTGIQSRSMALGGQALHWGATTPRFTPEDLRLRSEYGVGVDWPLDWEELERYYQEAEERLGVAGVQGPSELDPRSGEYPMPALELSYNLALLREWAERSGIPFWANPVAKNSRPYRGRGQCVRCDTCTICPTGAKYSPDFTFAELLEQGRIELLTRTLVQRLELAPAAGGVGGGNRVSMARALDRDRPDEPLELRAEWFVLAAGYAWSSHLLLLSACDRFPDGLANRSDQVGRYVAGHRPVNAFVEVPAKLYPGIYEMDSLLSKQFQRPGPLEKYVRHDLRIWETAYARQPRLRDDTGQLLLGDALLEDWRSRCTTGTARLRAYYDVVPAAESRLTLDAERRNPWGDPLPRIDFVDAEVSVELREHTESSIRSTFERFVAAGGGKLLTVRGADVYDHPAGGCRMGADPAASVVDPWGRCHDHENLFVVGAPTMPNAGCNNGTLTFVALTLRSMAKLAEALPARVA